MKGLADSLPGASGDTTGARGWKDQEPPHRRLCCSGCACLLPLSASLPQTNNIFSATFTLLEIAMGKKKCEQIVGIGP